MQKGAAPSPVGSNTSPHLKVGAFCVAKARDAVPERGMALA